MVNKTKTLDVFGIFETMRVELASKIKISQLVIHHYVTISDQSSWDYNLLPELCSLYFCIDNDGTIYQLLDTQHAAWQAGTRVTNLASVGVEISNAYYKKYNKT